MSHVSKIEVEITDLAALALACARLGLEFVQGQTKFEYYQGQKAACAHAIRVPGTSYEIGVTVGEKPGVYGLGADFWDRTLKNKVGQDAGLLKQAYVLESAKRAARRKGYSTREIKLDNGGVRLAVNVG